MSLFKILKGDSSRIDMSVTPFHDGYAYFTPDDGGFYIDSEDSGEQKRIRINPPEVKSTSISSSLLASGWSSGKQTLTFNGLNIGSNGVIGTEQNITDEQMEAVKKAELYVYAQGAGTLTVAARGDTPTIDIPVMLILFD